VDQALYNKLWEVRGEADYFKVLNSNLKKQTGIDLFSEAGSIPIKRPKVGQIVSFTDPQGLVKTGPIKEITGERAIINLEGKEIIATLNQLSMTPKEEAEIGKVAGNILKNNSDISRTDAEAMAKDVIENRKFNQPEPTGEGKVLTKEEFVKSVKSTELTTEDKELKPGKTGFMDKVAMMDAKTGEIFAYKPGEQDIYNHGDIFVKHKMNQDTVIAGFIDKKGEFVYQYPEEAYDKLKASGKLPPVEPPETSIGPEFEGEIPKKKLLSERVDITNTARERLKEVDISRKPYLRSIRKYKDNYLAEELSGLPTHYITKEGGITPDEAVQQLGLANENELVDYLKGLDAERTKLIKEIEQNKPELESHYETTLANEKEKVRLQMQKKAQKEMETMTEEHAKIASKMAKQALKEGKKIGSEIRKQKYFGSEVTPEQRKELYVVALNKGVIYTDYVGKKHDKLQGIIKYYKGASFDQLKEYINSLSGDPDNPSKLFKLYGNIDRDAEALKIINEAKLDWQDINKAELYTLDPYRTVEKVTKTPVWADNVLADNTTSVIASADEAMIDRKAKEHTDLESNREGILSGTKESAELMRKFEAKEALTLKEQKVVTFLRSKYDALIKEANEMRELVGKKPIPYRQDYMTHIIEQNILNEFFNGDELGMKGISQGQLDAVRKGDYTKGNMPFNKFAQKRLTDKTKYDAIGNYLDYLGVITKEIYYTPALSHARKFIEYALDRQPNAYKSLDRMLSDMKGKTSIADQNMVGAIASSSPVKWMRSHIARSALVGNINFWATNLSNFAISYDELGNYMNVGMGKFLSSKEWRKFAFENSLMLKGRSIDPDFIDQPIHTKLEEFVGSITNVIEYNNVGSTFVGAYLKGIEKMGLSKEKAVEYGDAIARRTQVGYKKYELNAWMRSNSGMLMSQFQSWTFNAMNHILYDLGTANIPKDIASMFTENKTNRTRWGAFLTLIVTAIVTNALYEKVGLRKPLDIGSAVPSVSGINKARYQDIGPVAVGRNIGEIFTAKKPATKISAGVKAVTAFIPGGTQIKRFIEGKVLPTKEKPKPKSKKRTRT
jgi:hypothetical protein